MGTNRYRGKVALPDWRDVALNNRDVIIAYDGDVARKQQVRQAMGELARYLSSSRVPRWSCLWLPDEGTRRSAWTTTWVAGHTIAELRQLVRPYPPLLVREDGFAGRPGR